MADHCINLLHHLWTYRGKWKEGYKRTIHTCKLCSTSKSKEGTPILDMPFFKTCYLVCAMRVYIHCMIVPNTSWEEFGREERRDAWLACGPAVTQITMCFAPKTLQPLHGKTAVACRHTSTKVGYFICSQSWSLVLQGADVVQVCLARSCFPQPQQKFNSQPICQFWTMIHKSWNWLAGDAG